MTQGALDARRQAQERAQTNIRGCCSAQRSATAAGSRDRTQRREPTTKKGVLVVAPRRRHAADEKGQILTVVRQAEEITRQPLTHVLETFGLPRATYYQWAHREAEGTLVDRLVLQSRKLVPATPKEIASVCGLIRLPPVMGYKRLAGQMVNKDIAYLEPHQVYGTLRTNNLFAR